MSSIDIPTVTGSISSDELGRTLMHEHLMVGYPGWEADSIRRGPQRDEMFAVCADRIAEMRGCGVDAMVDPCPNDLGRDVEFMAEVSQKSGFPIICATGLYKEDEGGAPYWKMRANFGGSPDAMSELFIQELEEGVGDTGIKPGIIKVATGSPAVTDYEKTILQAAAKASAHTDTPITTHTDHGLLGDEQQRILVEAGASPHRIIIGHSCGSTDTAYHMGIVNGGSYLGFDRFGLDVLQPDAERIKALLALIAKGATSRVVVAHDSVWCWRGAPIPNPEMFEQLLAQWTPGHFIERVVPQLKEAGAGDADIDMMLIENPRRFFTGEDVPALTAT